MIRTYSWCFNVEFLHLITLLHPYISNLFRSRKTKVVDTCSIFTVFIVVICATHHCAINHCLQVTGNTAHTISYNTTKNEKCALVSLPNTTKLVSTNVLLSTHCQNLSRNDVDNLRETETVMRVSLSSSFQCHVYKL